MIEQENNNGSTAKKDKLLNELFPVSIAIQAPNRKSRNKT